MEKQRQKIRVSYRFDQSTIDLLLAAQQCDDPNLANRPMTWLLQHAVKELYGELAQANNNGHT
jgi:hypothetical protein